MQIRIVRPADRWQFSRPLMEMHRHRKQVFIDALGWELAARGSWIEVDEFDNDYAVYVMAISADGDRHLGSVRLLPTTQPHMLTTVFDGLCPGGAPNGADVWEISRFVASPDGADGMNIFRIHRLIATALVDFAALNGISRYTLIAESRRVPALLSVGWTVRPISLPTLCGQEHVEAMEIVIDGDSIAGMVRRLAFRGEPALVSSQCGGMA